MSSPAIIIAKHIQGAKILNIDVIDVDPNVKYDATVIENMYQIIGDDFCKISLCIRKLEILKQCYSSLECRLANKLYYTYNNNDELVEAAKFMEIPLINYNRGDNRDDVKFNNVSNDLIKIAAYLENIDALRIHYRHQLEHIALHMLSEEDIEKMNKKKNKQMKKWRNRPGYKSSEN